MERATRLLAVCAKKQIMAQICAAARSAVCATNCRVLQDAVNYVRYPNLEGNEMIRLVVCLTVMWLALGNSAIAEVTYPIHVKDALDRDVTIPAQPKSILLGSGFNLIALSLIHPDPVSVLAGWADDLKGTTRKSMPVSDSVFRNLTRSRSLVTA